MNDILKIENLLKVLTDIAAWAEDLQNNMDRLREDLDEFCKGKMSSGEDDSNGSGSSFNLNKDDRSSLNNGDKDSGEDVMTDFNTSSIDDLNGSKGLQRRNSHLDLTIIIDLERSESSLVYDGTDFKRITDRVIDLEDEVVMYRNKIVYSVVKNRLVDMSEKWDAACLDRESRILIENKRYQDLMKKKQSYQEISLA